MSQEERRELFKKMRAQMGAGGQAGGGGGGGGGRPGGGGQAGRGGPPAGGAPQEPASDTGEFSAERRMAATLPRPPEEGSDVEILLRPGLLADAEIIVDSMEDVLYIPFQAVFDTPRGPSVYYWNGSSLEARKVDLGRRSESQVVVLAGLEEGDMISLEPPDDGRGDREKKTPKKKSGNRQARPAGGRPGGRRTRWGRGAAAARAAEG